MYKLKQIPEDFIVTEIPLKDPQQEESYLYFTLKKINRNTQDAVKEIAKRLYVKEKDIGYAGSKDKHAVTTQLISIKGVTKEKIESIQLDNIELKFYGRSQEPLTLGSLQGNKFEITIRNLENYNIEKSNFMENYFDEQRFSTNNVEIGKFILQKKFKEALELVDNQRAQDHLQSKPNDYVGALKKVPMRILKMYVHAYQSYIWNKAIATKLHDQKLKLVKYSQGELVFTKNPGQLEDTQYPLFGFAMPLDITTKEILKEEGITPQHFIVKPIPELSLEGTQRDIVVSIKDLEIGKEQEDELNQGKKKITLTFTLPKGSYATMCIKRLLTI